MVRKIAFLIPMFFLCLGLDNCKSPVASGNKKSDLYRYNVEVIYSDVAEGESDISPILYYGYYGFWGSYDYGYIWMYKIGEKKARCYLPKVLILDEEAEYKHMVKVQDWNKNPEMTGENIYVEGAYDLEISKSPYPPYETSLRFKMSKE